MKKVALLITILIIFNFIYSSMFEIKVYADTDPIEDITDSSAGDSSDSKESNSVTTLTKEQYDKLGEGKASIAGTERNISIGESSAGSVSSKFGAALSSVSAIFIKIISNVTNEGGYYYTDSKYAADKTGIFTISSLVFGEYLVFNAKPYQLSTDLNPNIATSGILKLCDDMKDIAAQLSNFFRKRMITLSAVFILLAIIFVVKSQEASDVLAWKKIFTRWVLCMALLFFFHYILIAIDNVSDLCMDSLWNMRKGLEDANYQSFEVTVETDVLESISKTGGVVSLAYSVEFFAIVIVQILFLVKYIIRTLGILFLYILAPIIITIHGIILMLGKDSDMLGNFFKSYIVFSFMQSFYAMFYIIFFFSLSEIAINAPILGIFLLYAIYRAGNIAKAMFGWELGSSIL